GPLAPLLCAGIIGYRALKIASPPPGGRVGFFGFGGSAHLTLQLAAKLGFETVVYSRSASHRRLAETLGATEVVEPTSRVGKSPSGRLDSALVFAPAGEVAVQALAELDRGGSLAIAAIHLSPIPPIAYDRLLFGERRIQGVEANTRADAREFLRLAQRLGLRATTTTLPLESANQALVDLKADGSTGRWSLTLGAPGRPTPPGTLQREVMRAILPASARQGFAVTGQLFPLG
ncbi:zinc-binding alcohol dehydrogenase family protein, partial [mine drainage metagenome]